MLWREAQYHLHFQERFEPMAVPLPDVTQLLVAAKCSIALLELQQVPVVPQLWPTHRIAAVIAFLWNSHEYTSITLD